MWLGLSSRVFLPEAVPYGCYMPDLSVPPIVAATHDEVGAVVPAMVSPSFRWEQLQQSIWSPLVAGFSNMTTLPVLVREELAGAFAFSSLAIAQETPLDDGRTVKLLGKLQDGEMVETVLMESPAREGHRRRGTVCVTSQVGCAVGCPFCATGRLGLKRSCSVAEVVDQVRLAQQLLVRRGQPPLTNIVYMGMGEPLLAMDTTIGSLRLLTGPGGFSPRRITVSTSGIVPGIRQLAMEKIPVRLAISLHAANDELRSRLVPVNRKYPLAAVVDAGIEYVNISGRRLTFEWCLIGGVNDTPADAAQLASLARTAKAHVNLIPMNRIEGSPWAPPTRAAQERFLNELGDVNFTIRDTRGQFGDAACGQLRATYAAARHLRKDGTLASPAARSSTPG